MKKAAIIILLLFSVGCTTTPKPTTVDQTQPPAIEQVEETEVSEIEEDEEGESIKIPNPFSIIPAEDWIMMGVEIGLRILLDMPGSSWDR